MSAKLANRSNIQTGEGNLWDWDIHRTTHNGLPHVLVCPRLQNRWPSMSAPTRRWKDLPLPRTEGLCRRYAAQPSVAAVAWVLPAAAPAEVVQEGADAGHACLAPELAEDESDASSRERPCRGLVPPCERDRLPAAECASLWQRLRLFVLLEEEALHVSQTCQSQQYQQTAKGNLWGWGIHSTTHNGCFAMASDQYLA